MYWIDFSYTMHFEPKPKPARFEQCLHQISICTLIFIFQMNWTDTARWAIILRKKIELFDDCSFAIATDGTFILASVWSRIYGLFEKTYVKWL